ITGRAVLRAIGSVHRLSEHGAWLGCIAEGSGAFEDVREGVVRTVHCDSLAAAGRDEDVDVTRIGGDAFDRASLSPELAADYACARAIVLGDFGDVARGDVLIARGAHLE